MRLSGLQNPQAARAGSPGKHSATGEHSRVAADALPGLRNCPAYTFTAAIGTLSRRRRNAPVRATKLPGLHVHSRHRAAFPEATSIREERRGVSPCRIIQPNLLPVGIRNQRLRRYIHIALPAGSRIANVQQRMARGVILRLLDIHRRPDKPVAGHPSLNQRPRGIADAGTAAALFRKLAGIMALLRGNQIEQRIARLGFGARMGP